MSNFSIIPFRYIQRNNEHFISYNQFRKNNYFSENMQGIPICMMPYVEGICKLAEAHNFSITHDQVGLFTLRYENPLDNVVLTENSNDNIMRCENPPRQPLMALNQEYSIHEQLLGDEQIGAMSNAVDQTQSDEQLVALSPAEEGKFLQHETNRTILRNEHQDIANASNKHGAIPKKSGSDISIVKHDDMASYDISNSVITDIKQDENLIENVNDIHEVNNEREIDIKETEFGWIEYSNKLCPGEYTISFGDSYSHPFCTCSHWLLYRLPCVHMFAVFSKVPGWRYDMLSPLYRVSPVLDIDYSCINYPIIRSLADQNCQTYIPAVVSVETQTHFTQEANIFENLNVKGVATEQLLGQTKDFFQCINKMAFLFKDKFLHRKLCGQLKQLEDNLIVTCNKMDPCTVFGEIGHALKQPTFHKENGKPLKISNLNLEQISEATGKSKQCIMESRYVPKIIPKTHSEITVSMIELPDGRNLESVLYALSRNNPSLKVLSASRIIKTVSTVQKPAVKSYTSTDFMLNENKGPKSIPSKIVTKNIAPNSEACEKPVVFRILPGATFNKGTSTNAVSSGETTVELDVNKAVPIHLEKTPSDVCIKEHAPVETVVDDFNSSNRKRTYPLLVSPPDNNGKKIKVRFDAIPQLRTSSGIICGENQITNSDYQMENNFDLIGQSGLKEKLVLDGISDLYGKSDLDGKLHLNNKTDIDDNSYTLVPSESPPTDKVMIKLEEAELESLAGINVKIYKSQIKSSHENTINQNDVVKTEDI